MTALNNVLFIGGPPGVGKTTVASIIARRHGLRLYSADTRTWEHRDRAIALRIDAAARWESLSRDARLAAPDEALVAMSLYRERGAMVLDDLSELPPSPLVVAEGTVIRPPDVSAYSRGVWLMADAGIQRQRLSDRDGQSMRLYEVMRDVIEADVDAARAPVIHAGSVVDAVTALESFFARELARGPRAGALGERRALLREANLDIVHQVRGYYSRPWANGDPESVSRTFICECGDTTCQEFVEQWVGFAEHRAVVALDHAERLQA